MGHAASVENTLGLQFPYDEVRRQEGGQWAQSCAYKLTNHLHHLATTSKSIASYIQTESHIQTKLHQKWEGASDAPSWGENCNALS